MQSADSLDWCGFFKCSTIFLFCFRFKQAEVSQDDSEYPFTSDSSLEGNPLMSYFCILAGILVGQVRTFSAPAGS